MIQTWCAGCQDTVYQVSFFYLTSNVEYLAFIFKRPNLINPATAQQYCVCCDNSVLDWDMNIIQVSFCSTRHLLHFDTKHVPYISQKMAHCSSEHSVYGFRQTTNKIVFTITLEWIELWVWIQVHCTPQRTSFALIPNTSHLHHALMLLAIKLAFYSIN